MKKFILLKTNTRDIVLVSIKCIKENETIKMFFEDTENSRILKTIYFGEFIKLVQLGPYNKKYNNNICYISLPNGGFTTNENDCETKNINVLLTDEQLNKLILEFETDSEAELLAESLHGEYLEDNDFDF